MTVSEKLRLVQGLHSHAEMFGFKWDDDSDWTWHDVACKIADEVDAENAKLRELVRDMHEYISSDYCHTSCKHEPNDMGCYEAGCWYDKALRELGIEVDA